MSRWANKQGGEAIPLPPIDVPASYLFHCIFLIIGVGGDFGSDIECA